MLYELFGLFVTEMKDVKINMCLKLHVFSFHIIITSQKQTDIQGFSKQKAEI